MKNIFRRDKKKKTKVKVKGREKSNSVGELLLQSAGSVSTRVEQIKVEDIFVDDGSIDECAVLRVSSSETPRRVIQKRCKSVERI